MNDIYWITRLDGICDFLIACTVISIILIVIAIIGIFISEGKEEGYNNFVARTIKYPIFVAEASILINIFIPTTKEAFGIYGVNETVKAINSGKRVPPDAIKAINKWYIMEIEEEKQNSINNANARK